MVYQLIVVYHGGKFCREFMREDTLQLFFGDTVNSRYILFLQINLHGGSLIGDISHYSRTNRINKFLTLFIVPDIFFKVYRLYHIALKWDLIFAVFADTTPSAKIIQRKFTTPMSARPYRARTAKFIQRNLC